jgi:hypothetical protein
VCIVDLRSVSGPIERSDSREDTTPTDCFATEYRADVEGIADLYRKARLLNIESSMADACPRCHPVVRESGASFRMSLSGLLGLVLVYLVVFIMVGTGAALSASPSAVKVASSAVSSTTEYRHIRSARTSCQWPSWTSILSQRGIASSFPGGTFPGGMT